MNRYLWASILFMMLLVATFVRGGNSDVREIRKSFNQFVDDIELKEKEDILGASLAARRMSDLFSQDTKIQITGLPFEISNRSDLQSAIIRARTNLDRFAVHIGDTSIEISSDRLSAVMSVSAHVTISGIGRFDEEWHAADVRWIKTCGKWEISSVYSLETIEHP